MLSQQLRKEKSNAIKMFLFNNAQLDKKILTYKELEIKNIKKEI